MPRAAMDPRSRFGFESSSYNPHLRMNNGTLTSVQFKIDQEKAKYEKTIKLLNMSEKVGMRIVQKQVEEVKKELTLMRAYQHVAKQMAFKHFDPVIRRRRERREKERQQQEEEAALRHFQQQQLKELNDMKRNMNGGEDDDNDDDNENDEPRMSEENRRLSSSGNLFLTLQDIMGNDAVLRRNSKEIHDKRRKSQASLEFLEYGDDSVGNGKGRKSSDASSSGLGKLMRSPRRGSLASSVENSDGNDQGKSGKDTEISSSGGGGCGEEGDFNEAKEYVDSSKSNFLEIGDGVGGVGSNSQRRRRSRAGSSGMISGLDSIKENSSELMRGTEKIDEGNEKEQRSGSSVGNKASGSLVVSGRKGFKTTGNQVKGFFITSSTDDGDDSKNARNGKMDDINDKREQPMSLYQISKYYEKQKSRHMEEGKTKQLDQQKRLEKRKYESLRRRLQKEKFDKENRSSEKSREINKTASAQDKQPNDSSLADVPQPDKISKRPISQNDQTDAVDGTRCTTIPVIKEPSQEPETPSEEPSVPKLASPLKGLARFKNAAATVSVQLKAADTNKNKTSRLKNIAAAAVMMAGRGGTAVISGRVPKSFMSNDAFAERLGRERDKSKATALETSHRNPDDCKIRPLPMPESVKAEYAEKWKSLMGNINGAVHWKVRALREDTGTMNSRQIRRQAREEQSGLMSSVSPRSSRNPPRSVFPGACKTTWAVKKFVSQEIDDVLKQWNPDNVRRKRNQKMKNKLTFPNLIDRVRTTTSILRSFRSYCNVKEDGNNDDGGEHVGGDGVDNNKNSGDRDNAIDNVNTGNVKVDDDNDGKDDVSDDNNDDSVEN